MLIWRRTAPKMMQDVFEGVFAQRQNTLKKRSENFTSFSNVALCRPGGHGGAAAPVPIPNTAVKRPSAYGTSS